MTISIETLRTLLNCNPETGELTWKPRQFKLSRNTWNSKFVGKRALDGVNSSGYRHGRVLSQNLSAHRVIWAMCHGEWPNIIDHINGDPSDNRLVNLRSVSTAINMRNRKFPITNTSGVHGVRWHKGCQKWVAYIKVDQRVKSLGVFTEIELAREARLKAEAEHGFHQNHGRSK